MKWSTIIKTHNIRVYDKNGDFSESLFFLDENGLLNVKSHTYTGVHESFNVNHMFLFNKHIDSMIKENFTIEILPKESGIKNIVNGWLIYQENNDFVIDDECGNKYYYSTYNDAVQAAKTMEV